MATISLEYEKLTRGIFLHLVPPLKILFSVWGINLELDAHWSDSVVPLALYFGVRSQTYTQYGYKFRGVFRLVMGFLLALSAGVTAGSIAESDQFYPGVALLAVVSAIVLFDSIDSAVSATWARKAGLTWVTDFARYMRFVLPHTILSVFVVASAVIISALAPTISPKHSANAHLLALAVGLMLVWYLKSWKFSGDPNNRSEGESQFARFRRSSATNIGDRIFVALCVGGLVLVANAGLTYL